MVTLRSQTWLRQSGKAEAEQEEKFAKKGLGLNAGGNEAATGQQGVLRPEPRPIDFEGVAGTLGADEKQIIDLHLLSEAQLQEKIEQNGHDVPPNSSKHYLVALCRKALKDPRAPKPKKEEKTTEPEHAIAEYRRPTIGDRVQKYETPWWWNDTCQKPLERCFVSLKTTVERFHTDWLVLESNGTGLGKMCVGQRRSKPKSSIEGGKQTLINQKRLWSTTTDMAAHKEKFVMF